MTKQSQSPPCERIERQVLDTKDLLAILAGVAFAPSCLNLAWNWDVDVRGLGWLIRATFTRPDTHTGVLGRGHGRWEFIDIGASESGVVKTCWLLAELVVRHELMEAFLYQGRRIFDPHRTVAELSMPRRRNE